MLVPPPVPRRPMLVASALPADLAGLGGQVQELEKVGLDCVRRNVMRDRSAAPRTAAAAGVPA